MSNYTITQCNSDEWIVTSNTTGGQVGNVRTTEADAIRWLENIEARAAAAETTTKTVPAPTTYRTKTDSIYGEGRVYSNRPGATQYDNGDGRHTVQIWDES